MNDHPPNIVDLVPMPDDGRERGAFSWVPNEESPATVRPSPRRRRWFQFGLRSILILPVFGALISQEIEFRTRTTRLQNGQFPVVFRLVEAATGRPIAGASLVVDRPWEAYLVMTDADGRHREATAGLEFLETSLFRESRSLHVGQLTLRATLDGRRVGEWTARDIEAAAVRKVEGGTLHYEVTLRSAEPTP